MSGYAPRPPVDDGPIAPLPDCEPGAVLDRINDVITCVNQAITEHPATGMDGTMFLIIAGVGALGIIVGTYLRLKRKRPLDYTKTGWGQ